MTGAPQRKSLEDLLLGLALGDAQNESLAQLRLQGASFVEKVQVLEHTVAQLEQEKGQLTDLVEVLNRQLTVHLNPPTDPISSARALVKKALQQQAQTPKQVRELLRSKNSLLYSHTKELLSLMEMTGEISRQGDVYHPVFVLTSNLNSN
jgi:hypothetical protein